MAIIGASRGLGAEIARRAPPQVEILLVARNRERLEGLRSEIGPRAQVCGLDVASSSVALELALKKFAPTRIFYLAGGGPYGDFQTKAWKDHLWAWEVTFLAAARIVHWALQNEKPPQIVLCGSSVAEDKGDPRAVSYSSAKHALRGLYASLKIENPQWDVRLFSPGYLDTELLPKGAPVRYKGVWNPEEVAKKFWDWACSENHAGHLSLPPHPQS